MLNVEKYIPSLVPLYCEPQRTYHSLQHIHGLVRLIENNKFLNYLDPHKVAFPTDAKSQLFFVNCLKFIAWFHDCYYDPYLGSPKNEELSAKIFHEMVMPDLLKTHVYGDLDDYSLFDIAHEGILSTAKHIEDVSGATDQILVFMDMDMHNFCEEKEFLRNGDLIRLEYPTTEDIDFFKGRKWFFEKILSKKKFYYTYKQEHEDAARRNIETSLKSIDAFLNANV